MSQISLKSISGITSITTPAGVDNRFSLYNFDSTERLVLDHSGNLNISGVSSATNFKTGFIIGLGILTLAILRLNEDSEESEKLRPMLAIIFGTIHGFGFANVLNEINLDRTNFLFSLLGFNLGVEIGQMLVLLSMWILTTYLVIKILAKDIQKITHLVSSILCSIGLYWFLTRLLG